MKNSNLVFSLFLPIIFILLWASGFSFVKIGLEYIEPLTFLAMRYFFVIILTLPIIFLLKLKWPKNVYSWLKISIIGLLIQFVYFCFFYLSISAGLSAGTFAMIASMQPILVGIISLYILNEKISYLQWVGLLLGTLGVIIVVMAKSTVEFTSLNSLLLACISLAGMTIGIIYEKRHKTLCHPLIASCIQCSIALIFTLPFALAFETNKIIWSFSLIRISFLSSDFQYDNFYFYTATID